jgi:tetratricopeptide (TPR) repeat protein
MCYGMRLERQKKGILVESQTILRSGTAFFAAAVWIGVLATSASVTFRGVVRSLDSKAVAQEEVRIDGGGGYTTSDSGEFAIPESEYLKVEAEVIFHVTHWVVVKPCEYRNGRTYLPPPDRIIDIKVLRRSDPLLKSIAPAESAIGCTIEEAAALFPQRTKKKASSVFPFPIWEALSMQGGPEQSISSRMAFSSQKEQGDRGGRNYQVKLAWFDVPIVDRDHGDDIPENRDRFLTRKAQEFGFTKEEFASAIDAWTNSVIDPYEKGLALLWQGQFAEAQQLLSEGLQSSRIDDIKRYVPFARAEYEQGHYKEAADALRRVLAVHPADSMVQNALKVTVEAEGGAERADGPSEGNGLSPAVFGLYVMAVSVALVVAVLIARSVFERERQKVQLKRKLLEIERAEMEQSETIGKKSKYSGKG